MNSVAPKAAKRATRFVRAAKKRCAKSCSINENSAGINKVARRVEVLSSAGLKCFCELISVIVS